MTGEMPADRSTYPRFPVPAAVYQKPHTFLFVPKSPPQVPTLDETRDKRATSPSATAGTDAQSPTPGGRNVEPDAYIALLSCGHWTHTITAEAGEHWCERHNGYRKPARDAETGSAAILTVWEYADGTITAPAPEPEQVPEADGTITAPAPEPEQVPEEGLVMGIAALALAILSPGSRAADVIAATEEGMRIAVNDAVNRRAR